MSKPQLINPTNEQELREQVLTEFKQVHKLAPADYTENCTNVVMSIFERHVATQNLALLTRLEAEKELAEKDLESGGVLAFEVVPLIALQSERALIEKRMM